MKKGVKLERKIGTTLEKTTESLEDIQKRVTKSLASLKEVHSGHKMNLARITSDIASSSQAVPTLEQRLKTVSSRYSFFQEMRIYVANLLGCLDEKVPLIDDCEGRIHALLTQYAQARVHRTISQPYASFKALVDAAYTG